MEYKIEQRIETLSENAILKDNHEPHFDIEGISISEWAFSFTDGWTGKAWLAKGNFVAPNYMEAYQIFSTKLRRVVPRVALIGQCFIEYLQQPILIVRNGSELAYFQGFTKPRVVGLMFAEEELKALKLLVENKSISEEFFYYWNDAVNSVGYPAKLLLMFSALEALAKGIKVKGSKGKKGYYSEVRRIIGDDLTSDLFGSKSDPNSGLRNRLVHGEYFTRDDAGKDYLNILHKKIVGYFNDTVFQAKLISENVMNPQRHFWGSKYFYQTFIRPITPGKSLVLKEVVEDWQSNDSGFQHYEVVIDNSLRESY